ncbi:MAG: ABC transporter permease [Flavipsychrobacter sp.]|nr:ABC transporter permease [Flavipsychrobacter sp.]
MHQEVSVRSSHTVIQPSHNFFDLKLKELWQYRDLLFLLVKRDFVSFYKQTIFGPLWFFIQPIFTTIVFTFIFGNLAKIPTDGIPQPVFYLAGISCWNYFSDCLTKTSTVFKDNAPIFGKVYFPRLIMPISIVLSNLVRFGVQFLLFLVVVGYYMMKGAAIHPTACLALFPVLVLLMAAQGFGFGLIISALTNKYRDLSFLVAFGVQLAMYATTVVYPLSAAPAKYIWLIKLNPMTPIIEFTRYGFLGSGNHDLSMLIYSITSTLILVLLGVFTFNKVEKNFIDTV